MNRAATFAVGSLFAFLLRAQDGDPWLATCAPMQFDPSRTGWDPGGRVSILHGVQWIGTPARWRSDALLAELCMRNTKRVVGSWFSAGLAADQDRMPSESNRLSSVSISPAVHLRSGKQSYLSVGIGVRWSSGTSGNDQGTWASQYVDGQYSSALPSGEPVEPRSAQWAEVRAGMSWSLKGDGESPRRRTRDRLIAGIAADHLGRTTIREEGPGLGATPVRFTGYVLGELPHPWWENGFFSAEVISHAQGTFSTARASLYLGKHTLNVPRNEGAPAPSGFKVGVGYRLNDALLTSVQVERGAFTFGSAMGWALAGGDGLAKGRRTVEALVQVRF